MVDEVMGKSRDRKKTSKVFKLISNLGFAIFMIIMASLIFIAAQSRITGGEPSLFGYRMYIVDSGSMIPTLPLNSVIGVKETTANNIEQGDVVTYLAGDDATRVTHRVVEVLESNEGFIMQGDANNTPDTSILEGDRIIGKLAFTIPFIGVILRELGSVWGIGILVAFGILMILISMILKKR